MTQSNRDLRDDIRDFWSDRAATFDDDPGHRIHDGADLAAWQRLFRRHLGDPEGRALLDLASGTGEIARLCQSLGFAVTGLDWSEPMLDRARAKLPGVTFVQADAERTTLPSASMDVIVTRHLVWTLVDPVAAFAEWFRVLRPGGTLLVVDGDFVSRSLLGRIVQFMSPPAPQTEIAARHKDILSRVHFSAGARADHVAALLHTAGFDRIDIDTDLAPIHRAQRAQLGWRKSLLRRSEHRYAISASKPLEN
ncbi:class I SAM-dependent methyltransferase [Pseudosulfitobacter pseudonitzschiae]|uniref:class I SAM-dependent methyltransferase n=1 Tax=Pseudosulfitobacter pseudonitzschiae TaxID=1402135 RepID=UPI001AF83510|nr:class I SAM-dependent methyltransferase [Pseudosulfitobacter pseudonitzschiae]MBM1814933.1 methyltransferase domain-containing protein [Pseudosulfitobacter pseudonitzschiae]MBM1831924.1 methyltransferase domain-containing protein [Pseudosulfitobacter pseudonitzschiae]MBM1836792.1 methyltransferase domain-containing protein [Pseudosulfitobacter pseudonitzschiae]MBM1841638.1 methyltransferase domain-containing protein [Pseudosulfitobacter pseudonitzschiae]MBM1846506.1 methyltransferase domain